MRFFRLPGCLRSLLFTAAVLSFAARAVSAQPQNYYVGDGGKGIRIAVLEPVGKGLSADERWMLSLVQGSITGDFNKYSAMTVIDRQNLERIFAEWKESMSGHYSDADRVKIGNLTNASHILTGSISKTANAFMLELSVTDVASGVRKASYSPTPISPMELEDLSAIKAAAAELLRQLGVELTAAARNELKRAADIAQIQAQTALSRGIAAQRAGTEVAALSYYYQAASFDPSLFEAANRSSVMAADISSGNIGSDVRNEIAWRRNWVARLKETEETFYNIIKSVDPPYTLYYSNGIERKGINFEEGNETVDLSVPINMVANTSWFNAMDKSLQAVRTVLDGLDRTNKKDEWGLGGWPGSGVTNTNPFDKWKRYDIEIAFELVNRHGRVIGSRAVRLSPAFMITNGDGRFAVSFEGSASGAVEFNGVSVNALTDKLTIRVASVNGNPPKTARFSIAAVSAEEWKEHLVWHVEKGVLMGFSGSLADGYRKRHGVLNIPSEVFGQPITAIGERAFDNNELDLRDGALVVTIPNSVRVIGAGAFRGHSVFQITIGENVNIGSSSLPSDFVLSYNRGGRRADTYYFTHGVWGNAKEAARTRAESEAAAERMRVEAERRRVEEEAEMERARAETERRRAEAERAAEQRRAEEAKVKAEWDKLEARPIRLGTYVNADFGKTAARASGSEWFDINYPEYGSLGQSDTADVGNFGGGLMLNIRISKIVSLIGELNYSYLWNEYRYGTDETAKSKYAVAIVTFNHTLNVPILLRARVKDTWYFEFGYKLGFPISSEIKVSSGSLFPYQKINDRKDFSEFRAESDQGIVLGVGAGGGWAKGVIGLRYVYNLTKWDKAGNFISPHTLGATFGLYIF